MSKACFEDIIESQGQLIYTNVGNSMYPLIQERDLLVIKKAELPLQKYDIPLYKRDSGQYVLHRIIAVKDGEYIICGDNRSDLEYGITDRHILGVLTDIIRDEKTIPVRPPQHKVRLWIWCGSMTLRKVIFRLRKYRNRKNKS